MVSIAAMAFALITPVFSHLEDHHGPAQQWVPGVLSSFSASSPCDVKCWLSALQITIPDQRFNWLNVAGNIHNISCTGISFGDLQSQLTPPLGASFMIDGLSIQCALGWGISVLGFTSAGSANASITNSQLNAGLTLQKGDDGLPSTANLNACSAAISVTSIAFQGDLSIFLDLFRQQLETILSSQLNTVICSQLRSLVQKNLTQVLQNVNEQLQPYLKPQPPSLLPILPTGMLDLRNSPMIAAIDYVLDDVIGINGSVNINTIANALTNHTGNFSRTDINYSFPISVPSVGSIEITINNASLSGLNTWEAFDLMRSASPVDLVSQTRLQQLLVSVAFAVNISTEMAGASAPYLYEEAVVDISLFNISLRADLILGITESVLYRLSDNQRSIPACLLQSLHNASFDQLDLRFAATEIQLLAANGAAEAEIDAAINVLLELLTSSFEVVVPAIATGVMGGPVRQTINTQLVQLRHVNDTCTDPDDPATVAVEWTIGAFVGAVVCSAVLIIPVCLAFFIVKRLHRRYQQSARKLSEGEEMSSSILLSHDAATKSSRSKWTDSIITSARLPASLRYGLVLILFCNIAMFISAHTSVGASVYIYVTLGDQRTRLPSLFDFSLGNTIVDMWQAEVYALSLLIAILSGAWPYLKLLLLLVCWIIPVGMLSRRNRERIFMALDALGKWSLIDAFVMTMMVDSFHFRIAPRLSPDSPAALDEVLIEEIIEPHWGYYGFLIATLLSLALTHTMLNLHRRDTALRSSDTQRAEEGNQKWEALHSYAFRSNPRLARFSGVITVIITLLLLMSIVLLIAGSVIYSFQFEFEGAFRLLLMYLGQSPVLPSSIITVGTNLPDSVLDPNGFGVRFIQVTWFCFSIGFPLVYLHLLLVLWLAPMTPRLQRGVFIVTEVFNAWSALEVNVVSIIAVLLQVSQFTAFTVGDRCDLVNPILAKYLGPYLDGYNVCFELIATLEQGCWLLFTSCVIYIAVGLLVQLTCHRAMRERKAKMQAERQALIGINAATYDIDAEGGSQDTQGAPY